MKEEFIALVGAVAAVLGAVITGLFALWIRGLDRAKYLAEITKLNSEAKKVDAETSQITSNILIAELDRIAANNAAQAVQIEKQREELDSLRGQILEFARLELEHRAENQALKMRIAELEGTSSATRAERAGANLRSVFPVVIPHKPNEFDSDEQE